MTDLLSEVARYQHWVGPERRPFLGQGEWEADYPEWDSLYSSVSTFLVTRPFESWTLDELDAVLYALARDNEAEFLADKVAEQPQLLLSLAQAAIHCSERDARWQLATRLSQLTQLPQRVEQLLLTFASDSEEYVRRRALDSLAQLQSSHVETLAIQEWNRPDKAQQWARMNALSCLHLIRSPLLGPLLGEAEQDERPYLSQFAKRLRAGDLDED